MPDKPWEKWKGRWNAFDTRLQSSTMGRAFRQGVQESVGFNYSGGFAMDGEYHGFLGTKGIMQDFKTTTSNWKASYKYNRIMGKGAVEAGWTAASAAKFTGDPARAGMTKMLGKYAGRALMSSIGPAFVLMDTYHGWKEGGLVGAATGAATSILTMGAFNMAISAIGGPAGMAIGAAAAGAYGYYAFGESAQAHRRGLKQVEMGNVSIDALGSAGAATMRQRSLAALQNSHINGRMALGNEASIMHTSYR